MYASFITGTLWTSKWQDPIKFTYEVGRFRIVPQDYVLVNSEPSLIEPENSFYLFPGDKKILRIGKITDEETPETITIAKVEAICREEDKDWLKLPEKDKFTASLDLEVNIPEDAPDNDCTVLF